MTTRGAYPRRLSHLWQLPLLLLSLAILSCAACLFVDARPIIALNQQLLPVRELMRAERPDAAAEKLTKVLASEKLPREAEAQVHLLLGETIEAAQKQRREPVAADYTRIIEQTQIALGQGAKPTGDIHRRIGESYEALGKPVEAVSQYRQAIAIDPPRALRLQRKVIDLELATCDWAPAESSLDAYLKSDGLTDAERAWAENEKAQLLIDRGECADARPLLTDALRRNPDPIAQAETRYRLGVCAMKLGSADEADKLLRSARAAFNGQHPLDGAASLALGKIAQDKKDNVSAITFFDAAFTSAKADAVTIALAQLGRGTCRIEAGAADTGVGDLRAAAEKARSLTPAAREEALASLRKCSQSLVAKGNFAAAVDLINCEQTIDPNVSASFHQRLASAYEHRADQIEQSQAEATGLESLRRSQLAREARAKAAEEYLAGSRAMLAAGEKHYAEAFWKAIELFDRTGASSDAIAAMELFATEHADDSITPDVLLRLGRAYESASKNEKAMFTYQRLTASYAKSPAAAQGSISLALLYIAKGGLEDVNAEKLLRGVVDSSNTIPDVQRVALLELARFYHRCGNVKEALPRLESFAQKFTNDEHLGEVLFLTADCYAQLAAQVDVRLASATVAAEGENGAGSLAQAAATKKQQLQAAEKLYARAAEVYRASPPTKPADQQYQQLSLIRRADCLYELGDYTNAAAIYQSIARNEDDPQAVAAQVQVANALYAMGKADEARSANERAKQMLHRLPAQRLKDGNVPMPKAYWEQWLKWTGTTPGTW